MKKNKQAKNTNMNVTAQGEVEAVVRKALPKVEHEAFAKGVPACRQAFVDANYSRVVEKVKACVSYKCRMGAAAAESMAVAAASYTLAGFVNGETAWPEDVNDWIGLARWKAEKLALDMVQCRKTRREQSVDEVWTSREGEVMDSPYIVEASMDAWRAAEAAKERQAQIRAVRYAIPKVAFAMAGKNVLRNYKIVRAVYQDGRSIPEVAVRFQIKENAVYQCLFRFRDAFEQDGRRYMDEYLAA